MRAAAGALVLAAIASCTVERDDGLGAPCQADEDCPEGFFCGADDAELQEDGRICVPEADCDAGSFGSFCAGPGFYSCVDDQVTWTSCEPGQCEDDECAAEIRPPLPSP